MAVTTATFTTAGGHTTANRRWVWRVSHSPRAAAGFVASSLTGLLLSTVAVGYAASVWHGQWVTNVASFGSWMVLWPATFLVNDRLLFR